MEFNDNELEEWGSFLDVNEEDDVESKLDDIDNEEQEDEQQEQQDNEEEDSSDNEVEQEEEKPKQQKQPKKQEKEEQQDDEIDGYEFEEDNNDSGLFQNITDYFVENKMFETIDPNNLKNIKSIDDFTEAMEAEINNRVQDRLTNQQKRISVAMGVGIPNDEIAKLEKWKYDIESYTDDVIDDVIDNSLSQKEQDFITNRNAENRKSLIMIEYKMRGYSQEKAERMYKASIASGSDVEDAKDARQYILNNINEDYKKYYAEAKRKKDNQVLEYKKTIDNMRKSIKEDKFLDDLEVNEEVRDKIFANAFIPAYKDKQGNTLSEIQAYRMKNPYEYDKMFSVFYTLTNGFTECDKFLNGKVKKEVKKSNKEFERKILSSASSFMGGMKVVGAEQTKKPKKDVIDFMNAIDFKFENNF